jgi:O-antigen/teichoic acid export membrane protein
MSTGSTTAETGTARFSRHVAWTLGARMLTAGGSLLAGVIVARWLGAASLGILASLTVITALALSFGSLGLPSAITFLVARERERTRSIVWNAIFAAFCFGGALAMIIIILTWLRPAIFGDIPYQLIFIIAAAIPFHMASLFCMAVFLGINDIRRYNLFDVLSQAVLVLNPVIAICVLGMGLYLLVSLNAVAAVLLSVAVIGVLVRSVVKKSDITAGAVSISLIKVMLGYGSRFYISMAASMIILRADLLIVNYFRGAAEAGVYGVSAQVATVFLLIPNVIAIVLFPRVTEARDQTGDMTCRVTRHAALIMMIICLAAIPFAFLLPVLYGPSFAEVPFQVLILLPGVYLLGLETVQVQFFNSLGVPRAVPLFWIVTTVLNILLNLTLIPRFGALAAAAVSSVSYALMFFLISFYFRSQTGKTFAESFVLRLSEFRELLQSGRSLVTGRSAVYEGAPFKT